MDSEPHRRSSNVICCFIPASIFLLITQYWCKYKKRSLAVLFLLLEAISFMLDQFGGSQLSFHFAAVVLSALSFVITIYSTWITKQRITSSITKSGAEMQNMTVEVVFSLIQLAITFVYLIRTLSGVKSSNSASFYPLVYSVISVVFAFVSNEEVPDLSDPHKIALDTGILDSSDSHVIPIDRDLLESSDQLLVPLNPEVSNSSDELLVPLNAEVSNSSDLHIIPLNVEVPDSSDQQNFLLNTEVLNSSDQHIIPLNTKVSKSSDQHNVPLNTPLTPPVIGNGEGTDSSTVSIQVVPSDTPTVESVPSSSASNEIQGVKSTLHQRITSTQSDKLHGLKELVLKFELCGNGSKIRAMKIASNISGVESVRLNREDNRMTVIGDFDPVLVERQLRNLCHPLTLRKEKQPKKDENKKKDKTKKVDTAMWRDPNYRLQYEHMWRDPVPVERQLRNQCHPLSLGSAKEPRKEKQPKKYENKKKDKTKKVDTAMWRDPNYRLQYEHMWRDPNYRLQNEDEHPAACIIS